VTDLALSWERSDPITTELVPCSTCGSSEADTLWVGHEHEYPHTTDAPFPMVRCRRCGLVRLNPRPAVSEFDRIYPPDYYAYHLIDDEPDADAPVVHRLVQWCKVRLYLRRLDAVLRSAKLPAGPVRLLDVGCGDGRLLNWYRRSSEGHRLETWGIEMKDAAAKLAAAAGHRVVVGRFEEDGELPAKTFDLILASHVIEHVADPVAFALRAVELLRPGGLFVFGTPNVNSVEVGRLRQHWGGNHFPRHWTLYDPDTAAALADKVGLRVERVVFQPNPIFWAWSCHSWLAARRPSLADRLFPPVTIFRPTAQNLVLLGGFTTLDALLRLATGRTGSMSVELRKPAIAPSGPVEDAPTSR
jgi:SAM-dependent methyltransferase